MTPIFLPGLPGGITSPFVATLGGTISVNMAIGSDFADPPHNPIIARGHRSGVPRVLSVDHNDVRNLSGTMVIEGAGKDDAIAQVAAINALLRGGTTLEIQSTDATYSVTLNILPSPLSVPVLGDPMWELKSRCLIPFTFQCEPYAYGPETTLVDAVSTTYPAVVDITVPGDYPAPLQLTFTGTGLHCLYAGLLPDQSTALPLWEAEDLTWAGGTSADYGDADAHGGYFHTCTAGTSVSLFEDTAMPVGTYMMLVRASIGAAGNCWFQVFPMTSGYLWTDGVSLRQMATGRLPASAVRGAGVSSCPLTMAIGTASAAWDYVGVVPTSWGWAEWHPSSSSATTTDLFLDFDGRWYEDDAADAVNGRSGGLTAVGDQRLVIFADTAHDSGEDGGTIDLTTTVKVVPRYALWR